MLCSSPTLHSALLALILGALGTAWAAPLDLDPSDPPILLGAGPHGGRLIQLGEHRPIEALAAVILTQEPGLSPPHPNAEPLGSSGRSWRIPTTSVAHAVDLGLHLRQRPGVRTALPDLVLHPAPAEFSDPRYPSQWYLADLDMPELYAISLGDPQIRVAVIDSGIDLDHPDLDDAFDAPYDAYDDDGDPRPDPGVFCQGSDTQICDHHGTSVAGIIGARADNGLDIVGLCPECTLLPIRMIGPGGGTLGRDVAAFEHAIDHDAAIINNSWGFTQATSVPAPLADVVRRAATESRGGRGALILFAAGNDDREIRDDELQAMPEVLNVSATDRYGLPTAYTNRGASVDLAAPSATVTLQAGEGVTTTFGGTSAAAPVVAGLAAWALSVDPELTAAELQDLMIRASVPSPLVTADQNGHHPIYGYGVISGPLLRELVAPSPEPEPEPRACGCDHGPGPLPAAFTLALLLFARRRSTPHPATPEPLHVPDR